MIYVPGNPRVFRIRVIGVLVPYFVGKPFVACPQLMAKAILAKSETVRISVNVSRVRKSMRAQNVLLAESGVAGPRIGINEYDGGIHSVALIGGIV